MGTHLMYKIKTLGNDRTRLQVPSLKKMLFIFYNKFVEIYKLLPSKTAYCVKRQNLSKIFFEKFAFYGLDMELEPEPEPELF
jgi:hypothetical protein